MYTKRTKSGESGRYTLRRYTKSRKKVFYIPIELKAREFYPQLLLALELVKLGSIVHIGSKRSIISHIESAVEEGGVLLLKGGMRGEKLQPLKKKLDGICVFDQEVTPNVEDRDEIRRRVPPSSMPYINKIFYIGDYHKEIAREEFSGMGILKTPELNVIGWPKLDLFGEPARKFWDARVNVLKERHGDYLIFVSDFGCISNRAKRSILRKFKGGTESEEVTPIAVLEKMLSETMENFERCLKFLKEVDRDPALPKVIIRPHPAEPKSVWTKRTRGFINTFVVMDSEVTPWLLAAKGVLHRGCTSAIQAAYGGTPIGSVRVAIEGRETRLACKISKSMDSMDDVRSLLKPGSFDQEHPELLERVSFASRDSATERFAAELFSIKARAMTIGETTSVRNENRVTRRAISFVKNLSFSKIAGKVENSLWINDVNKLLNGIKVTEIEDFIGLLERKDVTAEEIGHDHCVVYPK